MPIHRINPDGSRTLMIYPKGSRIGIPVSDVATVHVSTVTPAPVLAPAPKRMRGHAIKNEQGKFMPTGEGPGFASPPKQHQFRQGGSGGPGRPRGSFSYDTLIHKHLSKKRRVRVDGKDCLVSTGELIVMATIKDAAEGKGRDARKHALAEMARTFPTQADSQSVGPRELNASDALSLAEYEAELRQRLLEEIRAGEHEEEPTDEGEAP